MMGLPFETAAYCMCEGEKKQMVSEKTAPVAVVMGSDSDLAVMQDCVDTLKEFGIEPIVRIISAHRTPQIAAEFAGALAARTTLPVIGVPLISAGGLEGVDALLSTVQMPPGVPVATVAIGKAGAKNAAILAVQILALSDGALAGRLSKFKESQEKKVIENDSALR